MLAVQLASAFAAGASATPLRVGIDALRRLEGVGRSRVYGVLADHAAAAAEVLSRPALVALAGVLPPRPTHPPDDDCHDRIREALNLKPAPLSAGRVSALLGSDLFCGRVPVGALHPLVVTAQDYGGGNTLKYRGADDPSLLAGFVAGTDAARMYLIPRLGGGVDGLIERLVYNWHFVGELPTLRVGARGESLGLASAVAAVSAITGTPIPEGVAFTGRVDANGRLYAVFQIDAKLRAAADAGVSVVYVPSDCQVPVDPPVAVRACEHVADVIPRVFDASALESALGRLARRRPAMPYERAWASRPDRRPRALLSMVGGSDPIGTHKDKDGLALSVQEDGPILTACRELRPVEVHLFFTTAKGTNDYGAKAQAVKDYVAQLLPEPETNVCLHALPEELDDPTDLESLYLAMKKEVAALRAAELDSQYACFLNTASGTGQMSFVLSVLLMAGEVHGRLIHVRESRFVKDDRPRIREVVLPSPWATAERTSDALA